MKLKLNNKYIKWGLTAFLVIAASIVFYYFIFQRESIVAGIGTLTHILMPIVFGLATAYLLTPILNFIERKLLLPLCEKCKVKASKRRNSVVRGVSILFTVVLVMALIYLLLYMLISQLVPSIQNIVANFDRYQTNFVKWIDQMMEDYSDVGNYVLRLIDQYSAELDQIIKELPSNIAVGVRMVTNTATNILGGLWNFVIGFIISIYVMAGKEKFSAQAKKIAFALFEKETANTAIRTFRFTHKTFIGFLGGKIADSIIIGVLCFIGTSLMKTPYAVLVSVIIGVTNVIPFFGPYLGAIPSAILILIVDPTHPLNCLYFVLFILVLQQFDGNILGPKILGNSTGLTSFWVIFAITLFGGLFGVLGMIVGVPIFAVIYAGIKTFVNSTLRKKALPVETKRYESLDYVDNEGFHYPISSAAAESEDPSESPSAETAQADKERTNEVSDTEGK